VREIHNAGPSSSSFSDSAWYFAGFIPAFYVRHSPSANNKTCSVLRHHIAHSALSTLRQLRLTIMTISIGLSSLAFFHLLTHALFKALLFICARGVFKALLFICARGVFILWRTLRIFVLWVVFLFIYFYFFEFNGFSSNPTSTTDSHLKGIISTNCCIHTSVPPDDGPKYARNMQRLTKYTENKLCINFS
jgi:hypothetical protein